MTTSELKAFIETKIVASKSLDFYIDSISSQEVKLRSPLNVHLNHKGTAFGGNLYSLCTVAAYSLALNLLVANGLYTDDIVIAEGNIKYLKPVSGDILVHAFFQSAKDSSDLLSAIRTGKRIPVLIAATISSTTPNCAEYSARFAVKLDRV